MTKGRKKKGATGRERVTYCAVPLVYAPLLDSLRQDGSKYEGHSRAFLAKLALKRFLQAEGLLDEKGKPTKQGEGG